MFSNTAKKFWVFLIRYFYTKQIVTIQPVQSLVKHIFATDFADFQVGNISIHPISIQKLSTVVKNLC
jgi:hypothetical protein